ncbi:hypothetical protein C0583_05515 [Candidatus Parcubacteria bacterium]|nr:MAG: hypothetical protein C0583_05515 [Candidatus Parcubacteria bacterium]
MNKKQTTRTFLKSITMFVFVLLVPLFVLAQEVGVDNDNFVLKNLGTGNSFSLKDDANLVFEYKRKQNVYSSFKEFLMSLFVDQYEDIEIKAEVRDAQGRLKSNLKPQVKYLGDGEFSLSIDKSSKELRAGEYKLELEIIDGEHIINYEQDFSWGVLALNFDKAEYYNGEEAYLQMAVLNELGHTLCDSQLYLEITSPDGGVAYLNTDNGLIGRNSECGADNYIESPDYDAYYGVGAIGDYVVKLKAVTDNGEFEISDTFSVVSSTNFDIQRYGPTRINPTYDYDMEIRVRANVGFRGDVIEKVPVNFNIGSYEIKVNNEIENWKLEIGNFEQEKYLTVKNVDLNIGDELIIDYNFDAPDISPEFYVIGPLELGDFTEKREWQIASDDVNTYIYNDGTSINWITDTQAWDNTDNTYAERDIPRRSENDSANYLEGSSTTVPNLPFVISNVEIGIEGFVEGVEVTPYIIPRFGGSTNGSGYPVAGFTTTDLDAIQWTSVYSDANAPSTWTWSDVQDLDTRIYGLNTSNSQPKILYIDQIYLRVTYTPNDAPTTTIVSAFQKTDGTGAVDIQMTVDDNNDDDEVMTLVQYQEGTTCSNMTKATIDETDLNTTSDRTTDPKVENDNTYQIGNASGYVITSEGINTIDFDWLSDTDELNASSTYCIALTSYDGVSVGNTATTTVTLDNYPPPINNVTFSPSSGVLKIGDTATATIISDATGYTASTMTINGVDVSGTFIDNNDNTYTVSYTVVEGNTDRLDSDDLPISFSMLDASNNASPAYNTADAGNRPGVDSHRPTISQATITNNVYGIGDTITLVLTVTSDTDVYTLGPSTINGVNAQNLVKQSDTAYNVDYVVVEGNTDRSAGTIPISIVVTDEAGNQNNPAFTSLIANTASVDAHRPVITALAIPSLAYKVGDTITATATVSSDTDTYSLGATTINNVSATNIQKINNLTYTFDYTVQEGDDDISTPGAIPISAVFIDSADNPSTPAFTLIDANSATIDANTPSINTVTFNPSSGILKIGDTATATIAVSGSETGLLAGSVMIINGQDVSSTFTGIGGGSYTVAYTVVEGDTNRTDADDLPVNLNIQDVAGNISGSYTTASPSTRPGVDATRPVISSVNLNITSGTLKVGDIATATLTCDNSNYTAGTLTINSIDVSATFVNNLDNTYTVYYEVQEGNNDILDANDLPVSFTVFDINGNESNAFTSADPDNRPGVDANTPSINTVTFTPSSGVLKVGDTATATIAVSIIEAGLLAGTTMTINSIDVSSTFTDIGGGNYTVSYTVKEGNADILDTEDLPVNLNIQDSAGNISSSFTTADPDNRPGVDANTPSIPGNLTFVDHSDHTITIQFGSPSTDDNFLEYKIFYKVGISGVTENDSAWTQVEDADLADRLFNSTATTTISDLLAQTQYVFNIWAYDIAGNKASATTELVTNTNYAPLEATNLNQYKSDGTTIINNGAWTNENQIRLMATSSDPEGEDLDLYFEFLPVASSSLVATSVPVSACSSATAYGLCSSNVWTIGSGADEVNIINIPDSYNGYKWQVLACDNEGTCSEWVKFNASTPNVKVDNTPPSSPGNLVEYSKTNTTVTLSFGASSSEDNFREYIIYYKVGSSGVTENDLSHSSTTDNNLFYQDYNSATSTIIYNLSAGTKYVFNIYAYDEAANVTSASEITVTTDSAANPPTGDFNSVAQKTDGSGVIDISVEIDDPDNDDTLRLKLEYVAGASCDFSSPLDPSIDSSDENITADYGDPDLDNNYPYQIGTTSNWVWTSPGSNTVNFDWLSAIDEPDADGVYCLRLTANDGTYSQLVSATTTIYIDNLEPSSPGALSLNTQNTYDLVLNFGGASVENNFDTYKIFYKQGTSGVTENDIEHIDTNLLNQNYNSIATTSVSSLQAGTDYVFNIWAYDLYGNKSSSSEVSVNTNHIPGLAFSLLQRKTDQVTPIENGAWTDESNVFFSASVNDDDPSEVLSLYYEIRYVGDSFLTATTVPENVCGEGDDFLACSSKVWSITSSNGDYSLSPYIGSGTLPALPDSSTGFKWQVLACDDNNVCSDWVDAGVDPNFKVDTVDPSSPGNLSFNSRTYNSVTLDFGATTTEDNFREYIIYYKTGASGVTENDSMHSSTTDINLFNKYYNGAQNTTISDLL